jgi:glycosyltransferase involved in cell wall biosynthesis
MKVLLVNHMYAPEIGSGAEATLANLAAGMRRRGVDVRVATTSAGDKIVEDEVAGIRVTRVPLRNIYPRHGPAHQPPVKRLIWHVRDSHNPAMGVALEAVIAQFGPDVVAFHNLNGFSSAAWDAAYAQGKPTVQVLHDYYHLCPRSQLFRDGANCTRPCTRCRVLRHGRAAQSNRLKAVVGVSHAVLDAHVRNGLFAEVAVRKVINNAWPVSAPEARSYPATATTFGFIGALAEWKGIRHLLDAFRRVIADDGLANLRLLVGGQGNPEYEAELRATYASDRVEFLGRVSPESFYRQIDVCVVPSIWHDPLPSVVFESLLFGVPVIGARRGGIPEMVSERVNGLLYEPDDPAALDACIRDMATAPGMLGAYGESARRGSGHFADIGRVVDEHLAACEAAASQ